MTAASKVVEIASNDGYLLQYFVEAKVPCLGVEPAANVAAVAQSKGMPTEVCFFGAETAARLKAAGHAADLLLGNNVLAHVPDINDFVRGMAILLKADGAATMEFPHLLRLIESNQFDTIYHEHFSYLSLLAVERIFAAAGLRLFDVDRLPTHGGSVRIYACRQSDPRPESSALAEARAEEAAAGLDRLDTYSGFEKKVYRVKRDLLSFLLAARDQGKTVAGYGAAAKGTTLLNYCGVRRDLLDYVVDLSPHKQGHFIPGVRIPIHSPQRDGGDAARLSPDLALEPPRGDRLPDGGDSRLGRQVRRGRSAPGGFRVIVEASPLPGLKIVTLEPRGDQRGAFCRLYCPAEYARLGLEFQLCQINLSSTSQAGTVRGMHFQREPKAEAKIVQCVAGEIFDVAIDLRPQSPTFCQWHGLRLGGAVGKMFYIPAGFAHGFQTLTDHVEVLYFMGEFFDPRFQAGVRWNDPAFGIAWPLPVSCLSPRDANYTDFKP